MANDPVDLLQIKIEQAKAELPEATVNAIAAVDWKAAILSLREKKGYNFEQLGDLELETELLLCGLISPKDYPKELEARMRISRAEAAELVEEMNRLVFRKIKEEMIKNSERKKIFAERSKVREEEQVAIPAGLSSQTRTWVPDDAGKAPDNKADTSVLLRSAGIEVVKPENTTNNEGNSLNSKTVETREEILKKVENPTPAASQIHPILGDKLSGSFQTPIVKREHIAGDTDQIATQEEKKTPPASGYAVDPYREVPE